MTKTKNKILLEEWAKLIKIQYNYKCCVCENTKYVQAHHLLCKERYLSLKYNTKNGIALCSKCHKFGKFSAHRNGIWFSEWLKENQKEKYNWCLENINEL